jgi:hypothetical protein
VSKQRIEVVETSYKFSSEAGRKLSQITVRRPRIRLESLV